MAHRLLEQRGNGNTTRKNGLGGPITLGLTHRLTNDPRVASLLATAPPQSSSLVPVFGPPHLSHTLMNLSHAMSVMSELGAGSAPLIDPTAAQTFWKPSLGQWKTQGQKRFGY